MSEAEGRLSADVSETEGRLDGNESGAPGPGPDPDPGDGLVERRLHPVTPLRRAWAPVAVIVGWAVHDPDQAQRQLSRLTTTTLLVGLAVLIPAAALYGFMTWWFTHFAVTDTELRIRTGLLFGAPRTSGSNGSRPSTSPSRCSPASRVSPN